MIIGSLLHHAQMGRAGGHPTKVLSCISESHKVCYQRTVPGPVPGVSDEVTFGAEEPVISFVDGPSWFGVLGRDGLKVL